jgi:4-hydroxy-3-polyprenylbenzoate decarboxylase
VSPLGGAARRPARLVVGISGSTGVLYGIRLLQVLRGTGVESHLVMTAAARKNLALETDLRPEDVEALATHVYRAGDLAAPISSGSFRTDGMVVIPCSIKTLSAVAHSYDANLLVRAADVTRKEGRRLVLVVRETPLHAGHLRLMTQLAEDGVVILPPVPAFYHRPRTIEDLVDHTVGKVLDQFGIDAGLFQRWGEQTVRPARLP